MTLPDKANCRWTSADDEPSRVRIGPKMALAVAYVRRNPGCAILPVALFVGPNRSRRFGYATVHRCIRAGLIRATKQKGGHYHLEVIE